MATIIYIGSADGAFTWASGRTLRRLKRAGDPDGEIRLGVLKGGMASGRSSVVFGFELEDGSVVFAETTLRLFAGMAVGVIGTNMEELIAADIVAESPVDTSETVGTHSRVGACACGKWHQPVPPGLRRS